MSHKRSFESSSHHKLPQHGIEFDGKQKSRKNYLRQKKRTPLIDYELEDLLEVEKQLLL